MKKTVAYIFIFCAAILFNTSCGDDLPGPENDNTVPVTNNVKAPTITESSISYNAKYQIVSFKASCPEGTKVMVLFRQLTNGSMEKLLDVDYNSNSQHYFTQIPVLTGGSDYVFCIIGYDAEGKEVTRSKEYPFSLPKDPAPEAPLTTGITVYPPTSAEATDGRIIGTVITKAMEYSIDEGKTWTPVTEAGKITNLPPCTLLLRLTATATTEASLPATIVVPPYHSNTDLDGKDGTSEGLRVRRT